MSSKVFFLMKFPINLISLKMLQFIRIKNFLILVLYYLKSTIEIFQKESFNYWKNKNRKKKDSDNICIYFSYSCYFGEKNFRFKI